MHRGLSSLDSESRPPTLLQARGSVRFVETRASSSSRASRLRNALKQAFSVLQQKDFKSFEEDFRPGKYKITHNKAAKAAKRIDAHATGGSKSSVEYFVAAFVALLCISFLFGFQWERLISCLRLRLCRSVFSSRPLVSNYLRSLDYGLAKRRCPQHIQKGIGP